MSERPIFVVGCPRSGTTMLQLMLHAHPRIAVPPESRILVQAYRERRTWGDLRRPKNRRALARWIARSSRTQFPDLGVDGDEFIRRAVEGPGSLGSVVGLVFQMFAELHGKARWGDKRPPYIRHLDAVLAMFPDAQIIHLIRDGRDCVSSLKEMPWFKGDIYEAVYRWTESIDIGRGHKLPPDSYYELRYEDLTTDPAATLTALCTFIGEAYDPVMREPYRVADVVPSHKDWHINTRQAVTTTRAGSWSQRLEPWEVSLCETVMGERLTAYGYELSGAPKAPRKDVSAYDKTASTWRRELRRTALTERINRFREPGPVAALLTTTQRELAGVHK
ncbi:sulfotransferase [Acrocarpospora phusangensis]|uniref:Sulfotransferase n=1 Tax=Acrocarpospora phusangensis TaxID=1070424 RepID=A0A919UTV4_9ACTN|nr:sulfotransferase [Acrocarpospora phusangensis]GIH27785.1 sulfotransferase [Acrocarpospora phusangensis]